MSHVQTLRAGWVFPVAGPPLRDAVVTWSGGVIEEVAPYRGQGVTVHFPSAAVIPGLVNAHIHLDLTHLGGRCPPGADFTGWLRIVIRLRRASTPEEVQAGIRAGVAESLAAGVTTVGDIDGGGDAAQILAQQPLRAVVFRELLGLPAVSAERSRAEAERWLAQPAGGRVLRGLSPHAPYSTHRSLWQWADQQAVHVATHLAESPTELELLAHHAGPFVSFLKDLGVWAPEGLLAGVEEPLRAASRPWLVAHGNYFPAPAWPVLHRHHVVYCPRTHAAFGHAPHPFADMFQAGINVALGTDSRASNPDLDLWQEVRLLWSRWPASLPPSELLAMATRRGALALGQADAGTLTPGAPADLVVMPLAGEGGVDPYEQLFAATGAGRRVLLAGEWID